MKSAEETKKGLECCAAHDCNGCGYNCGASTCIDSLLKDISSLIQQLQQNNAQLAIDKAILAAENAEQAERIQQLEAERDALMVAAKGECHECKFSDCSFTEAPCDSCFSAHRSKWEWRGVQKEE